MNDLPHKVDRPPRTRDPLRGMLVLYLFGMIAALGVNPAIKVLESKAAGPGLTMFLMPVGLMIPFFVAVG